eukprot:6149474-Pleurochrysis_carterae.AAC.4
MQVFASWVSFFTHFVYRSSVSVFPCAACPMLRDAAEQTTRVLTVCAPPQARARPSACSMRSYWHSRETRRRSARADEQLHACSVRRTRRLCVHTPGSCSCQSRKHMQGGKGSQTGVAVHGLAANTKGRRCGHQGSLLTPRHFL